MNFLCECNSFHCTEPINIDENYYLEMQENNTLLISKGCNLEPTDVIFKDHGTWVEIKEES